MYFKWRLDNVSDALDSCTAEGGLGVQWLVKPEDSNFIIQAGIYTILNKEFMWYEKCKLRDSVIHNRNTIYWYVGIY